MAKKKKRKTTKAERFIYKSGVFFLVVLLLAVVFGQSMLSKVNLEVEKLKDEVVKHEDTNQSLTMKINEMASLENIQNIANNMGLSYNNENIKTIKE
ncbi:MAG: septum formation initiator family protein [bacterium]|nr:septum formation initiator family protein [bacterium]